MAGKTRRGLLGLLTAMAFVFSLAGGMLIASQIAQPEFLDFLNEPLRTFDQEYLVVGAATLLPVVLIIAAYAASLRSRAPRRPVFALYLLGLSIFWLVLAYVATSFDAEEFFMPIPLAFAGAAWLVLATSVRTIEILMGKVCMVLGGGLLRRQRWQAASTMLGAARRFLPGSEHVARDQGLALYEIGEAGRALEILVESYRRGERDPRLVRMLADSAFQLPEDLTGEVLAEALKLEPDNTRFGRKLVDLHLQHARPAEALPVLDKFYDSDNLEDVCLLGRLNAEQGNVERALELTQRAMELDDPPYRRTLADLQVLAMQAPENPRVLLTLAELNEKIKNREEAASWYLNLLEIESENTEVRRRVIRLYRELGRLNQALPHYRLLLRQDPESPEVALEYGQLLEDRQDLDKALKVFEDFAARYPKDPRFAYHCAVNLFGLGCLDKAAEALEQARANAPTDERAAIQSLGARIQSARVEHELTALRKQAHGEDASLDQRLALAERLVTYQKAEEAARELDLLLEEHPDQEQRIVRFLEELLERGEQHFVLLNLLAGVYLKKRDFDRCHQLHEMMAQHSLHPNEILADGCRQILRQQPNHLPALKSHSTLLIKGGHYSEAAVVLGKILDLSPPARDDLLPMLFEVYYQLGDADRAVPYGEELLKRDPENLNRYLRLHELFSKRDDHRRALLILERALEVAPENRQLREMVRESQTRVKESRIEALREQLESSPDQPSLLHEMADLYVEFERLNDAMTAYQRAAQHAEGNLRNLSLVKLAHCLTTKQMFDLAGETLRELDIREKDPEHLEQIKHYLYEVGGLFEEDEQFARALEIYKKLFKIDAGYKEIVAKIEALGHLAR